MIHITSINSLYKPNYFTNIFVKNTTICQLNNIHKQRTPMYLWHLCKKKHHLREWCGVKDGYFTYFLFSLMMCNKKTCIIMTGCFSYSMKDIFTLPKILRKILKEHIQQGNIPIQLKNIFNCLKTFCQEGYS